MKIPDAGDRGFTQRADGILVPREAIRHREEEYGSGSFEVLHQMQRRHFWYVGRHRFILHALTRTLDGRFSSREAPVSAIDMGGGCGGWVAYLGERAPGMFRELALADSALRALEFAEGVCPENTPRFQVDLLRTPWDRRWDVMFLLDVLEHIPDDAAVLRQMHKSLKKGGLLLVTTPALRCFWSYNDTLAKHVRRYSRGDFAKLAAACGFRLVMSRYFMFLLSPLLVLSRLGGPKVEEMSEDQRQELLLRTHRTPAWPINSILGAIFGIETPAGVRIPFPWGASVLGVFEKID